MSVSLLSTRQFLELTPWTERQWYQARYKHPNRFPEPVGRDKTGNLYCPEDVLPFVSSVIAARKALLTAEREAVLKRIDTELAVLEAKSKEVEGSSHFDFESEKNHGA